MHILAHWQFVLSENTARTAFLGRGDHFGSLTPMLDTRQNFNAEKGQIRSGMDGQSDAVGEPRP